MLFKEIIAVYSENRMKPINSTVCGQSAALLLFNVNTGATWSDHEDWNG
jgi:hypothetical protein